MTKLTAWKALRAMGASINDNGMAIFEKHEAYTAAKLLVEAGWPLNKIFIQDWNPRIHPQSSITLID